MLPENIIYIGIAINLIGTFLYIRSIFFGDTKPNLVSWFIWMLAPFIGVYLQLKAGAGMSLMGTFMAGFGPFLIIIFSLFKKNAYWKITTLDIICGFISLLALVFYVITNKLGISILFAIISDGIAAIPTIKKSWIRPESESSFTYLAGIINNTLSLLIIRNWIFSIYAFSVYLICVNITIVYSIYHKKYLIK